MSKGFIPPHGGYRNLLSYQKAEIVYDATVYFCDHFIDKRSRTHDQMVQAARSGKQNIVEGSMAAATSKETEIKLTNVARASLEELLVDYRDFLRTRGLEEWPAEHAYALRLRKLNQIPGATYETFRKGIENPDHRRQCDRRPDPRDHLPTRPPTPPSGERLCRRRRSARAHDPSTHSGTAEARRGKRLKDNKDTKDFKDPRAAFP